MQRAGSLLRAAVVSGPAIVAVATVLAAMGALSAVDGSPTWGKSAPQAEANWPQWRGPLGNGVAPLSDAPVRFSATDGVKWKVEIPGRGFSSPIVWNDLVFVTTAVPGADETLAGDRPRRRRPRVVAQDFRVIALRRADGGVAWSQTAIVAVPHEGYHRSFSSFANPSPVTDGERVYAFFGSRGLYAYDFSGELVWSRDFGVELETFGQFGESQSPALHGDTIVVVFDHEGQSFIEALHTRTGATLWRQLRDEETSWSSPFIVAHGGRDLVVTSGGNFVHAYDLESGEVVWQSRGMTPHPIPTPTAGGGKVFAASGSTERRVLAIELGHSGDLTGTSALAWSLDKAAPYNSSPLLWDDELYLVRDGGMNGGSSRLSLLDAGTGEPRYLQKRLPGSYTVKASPAAAGDRVYLLTEEGDVLVIRRGPAMEVLAINPMEEPFIASPAIAHGELFLRSRSHLFCIAAQPGG